MHRPARCSAPSGSPRTTSANRRWRSRHRGTRSRRATTTSTSSPRSPRKACVKPARCLSSSRRSQSRDGIAMGHEGMKASLMSREVIADSVELVMHAERFDGLVGIAGCDKSEPAMLMAMARLNLPSVYLYGGTILPGTYQGRDITIQDVFEAVGRAQRRADERRRAARDRARRVSDDGFVRRACTRPTRWPRPPRRSGCRFRARRRRPPSTTAARSLARESGIARGPARSRRTAHGRATS